MSRLALVIATWFGCGYAPKGGGGALLKQVPGENGTVKIEEQYKLETRLANKHGGLVLIGDYLYGATDDKPPLYCANRLQPR